MQQTLETRPQVGSLRIRVSPGGLVDLVRYNGNSWDVATNNDAPYLQQGMREAVQGQGAGYYVPAPSVANDAQFARFY